MPKTARNRNALHDVLAQGASNRDITVYSYQVSTYVGNFSFFFCIGLYKYSSWMTDVIYGECVIR